MPILVPSSSHLPTPLTLLVTVYFVQFLKVIYLLCLLVISMSICQLLTYRRTDFFVECDSGGVLCSDPRNYPGASVRVRVQRTQNKAVCTQAHSSSSGS